VGWRKAMYVPIPPQSSSAVRASNPPPFVLFTVSLPLPKR
jgi:hypothetical protein